MFASIAPSYTVDSNRCNFTCSAGPQAVPTDLLSQRLIDLESTVAHLEHELEQMHSVLLAVQAEFKASRERLAKLEQRIIVANDDVEQRDALGERPPHY